MHDPHTKSIGRARRTRNTALDLLKVAAFCFIVALHTVNPVDGMSTALNICARVGVPLFFAVSGYFAFGGEVELIGRRTARVARIAAFGLAFYLVVSLSTSWGGGFTNYTVELLTPQNLLNLIYFNAVPQAYHLWFLFALVYTYGIYAIAVALGWGGKAFVLVGAAALVLRWLLSEWGPIDPLSPQLRTWLFMGIPFFALGVGLKIWRTQVAKAPSFVWVLVFLVGMALSFAEYRAFGLQEIYVGTVLAVFALFAFCVRREVMKEKRDRAGNRVIGFVAKLGQQPILIAYVVHLFVVYVVDTCFLLAGYILLPYEVWVVTCVLSLLIGAVVAFCINRVCRWRDLGISGRSAQHAPKTRPLH